MEGEGTELPIETLHLKTRLKLTRNSDEPEPIVFCEGLDCKHNGPHYPLSRSTPQYGVHTTTDGNLHIKWKTTVFFL